MIDFKELKAKTTVEDVLKLVPNDMTRHIIQEGKDKGQAQYRGKCPVCVTTNPRALVLTMPSKFYCWGIKNGGSVLDLIIHIRGVDLTEAAKIVVEHLSHRSHTPASADTPSKTIPSPSPTASRVLEPLSYLEPSHQALQALGVSVETAQAFGSGYAPKGVLRQRYAVPVRDARHQLLAYVGIAVTPEQSPRLLFHSFSPEGFVWNTENVAEGGDLHAFHDPLDAILAVENGIPINQVVSFLAPVTAQSLVTLAALLDELKIESIEFH